MKPYVHMPALGDNPPTATLYYGQDARLSLQELEADSVHMACTSPPYWGLRDYGVEPSVWGALDDCDHEWGEPEGYTGHRGNRVQVPQTKWQSNQTYPQQGDAETTPQQTCVKCGAWKGVLGMEPEPEMFVEHLVEVFSHLRRVLRSDGTLWVNLGDSYVSTSVTEGFKVKDMAGIPWRFALAMQAAGWYLRSDIIWTKPNAMPESVKDRPTKSHEYVFLFAHPDSGGHYYYDHEAVKEPVSTQDPRYLMGSSSPRSKQEPSRHAFPGPSVKGLDRKPRSLRNRRSVWNINTKPYSGAHFAVWPPDLARIMIKAGCPEGGTVLDTFSGSATTGVVALQEGRNYVGLDLGADYLDLAKERLEGRKPGRGFSVEEEDVSIFDMFEDDDEA